MNKPIHIAFILAMTILLASCDRKEEDIPGYIYIPDVQVSTDVFSEGTSSSKITEVYCYVGGKSLGIYTLPALIPVLEEGEKEVQLFAGVRANGITNLSDEYPFYQKMVKTINFQPTQIDTINFTTSYSSQANFLFEPEVGFEGGTLVFTTDLDGNTDNGLVLTQEEVFEGEYSGKIHAIREDQTIEVGSNYLTNIADVNGRTYLELDYKTDIPFFVGIVAYSGTSIVSRTYNKGINVKDNWNKIYLDFDDEMTQLRNSNQNVTGYRITFFVDFSVLNSSFSEGTVYLDNIKLIQSL